VELNSLVGLSIREAMELTSLVGLRPTVLPDGLKSLIWSFFVYLFQ
jgi:hypothetical protein